MIRECSIKDLEKIKQISEKTFLETFEKDNLKENLTEYINNNITLEKLKNQLINKNSFFYFVIYDKNVAGFLKLNIGDSQTENMGENYLEIERIYILEQYKGKGLGKKFIDFSLDKAKELCKSKVWLGVWEHNYQAIKFYEKLNFRVIGKHNFYLGSDKQTDYIMEVNI
ncbi:MULTISPECIES: GNAT family N-acetyltransferase [unclassified Gemella]|uniref:GNAT family N-acetyltransferase n=1 Tax=unclassified Gemella TaxID=2624949 RepID=UPI001C54D4F3|nr:MULTISPECIES: GNAT family N-acetyltransferase [unclassified Gemella]